MAVARSHTATAAGRHPRALAAVRKLRDVFQELTLRCPACQHEHTEAGDEGPGLWSGTRTEMDQKRASLLHTWARYADVSARTVAERHEAPE